MAKNIPLDRLYAYAHYKRMPTTLSDIKALNSRAVSYSVDLVNEVTVDNLTLPTPCVGWALADLLAHMTAQHRGFAAAAAGHGGDMASWEVESLGQDAVARYRAAASQVLANFAAVESADQTFVLPEFKDNQMFPARLAIGFHFIDYVVHGWDVARSLGVAFDADPEVLAAALPVALAVPDGDARRKPGAAFRPGLAATDDTSPLARVLSVLGRSPNWPN